MPPDLSALIPTNGQQLRQLLLVLLVSPVLEEFVLRAGVQHQLIHHHANRLNISWRLLLVALLFAAMHLVKSFWLALAVIPAGILLGHLYESTRSWRKCAAVHSGLNLFWLVAVALISAPAHADALRGKTLYASSPPSGGASCAACHGADPTQNISKILRGANNPSLITSAINGNTGGMGILKNKWTATDINDMALYLANPTVSAGAPIASVSPATLSFASAIVGTSAAPLQATLSNTGTASLAVTSVTVSGTNAAEFVASPSGACQAGGSLPAGSSCTISVSFTPQGSGARSASIAIVHALGQSNVALSGTGTAAPQPSISINTNLLSFGSVVQNSSAAAQSIVVTNSGQAALVLSALNVTGVAANSFPIGGNCVVGNAIAVGGSCTLSIGFQPASIASFNGTLSMASNASNGNVLVSLQGIGVAAPAPVIVVSPANLAFGTVTISSNAVQTISVQNLGNAAATLGSPSLSGQAAFTLVSASACGNTLAAGASCALQVRFSPSTAGAQTGTLQISSNAAGSPHTVALAGSGSALPAPVPSLSQVTPLSFATTTVGQRSSAATVTAGNSGSASYTISSILISGVAATDFAMTGDCVAGKLIASAASCSLSLSFAPTTVGVRNARVDMLASNGTSLGFTVQGTGQAVATSSAQLSSTNLDFGSLAPGATSTALRTTLLNTGNQALTIDQISASGPFNLLVDNTTCAAVPFTLAPAMQCDIALRFVPVASGAATGSLNLASTAASLSISAGLQGRGLASAPIASTPPPAGAAGSGTGTGMGSGTSTSTIAAGTSTNQIASPLNAGAGGCSASTDGNDITLVVLMVAAACVGWRRRSFQVNQPRPGDPQ